MLYLLMQGQLLRQCRILHVLPPLTSPAFFLLLQRSAEEDVLIFVVRGHFSGRWKLHALLHEVLHAGQLKVYIDHIRKDTSL